MKNPKKTKKHLSESQIEKAVADQIQQRGLQVSQITLKDGLIKVGILVETTQVSISARFTAPRRKRSFPEVSILPNPYAYFLEKLVKDSIYQALLNINL